MALTLSFFVTTKGFRGLELYLGWILLACTFGLSIGLEAQFKLISFKRSIGSKYVFFGLVFLLLSVYVAVPGSIWWGLGNWKGALNQAVWMTPFLLLYLINTTERVYFWLIPLWVVHALVISIKALDGHYFRQAGLLDSSNPAGAFLALGCIYLLTLERRGKVLLLVPLLVLGILVTGSRSALVVLGLVGFGILIWRIRARLWMESLYVAGLYIVGVLVSGLGGKYLSFRLGSKEEFWLSGILRIGYEDLLIRWELTSIPSILPQGITHSWGLHSLPLRVSVEFGILAALVWIGITLYSLYLKPRFTVSWWILLVIAVLAISEYSIWLGPLAAIWWVTIGLRVKGRNINTDREIRSNECN